MKITYITMQFPSETETFASLDVKTLINKGHEVNVICLKKKHKKNSILINDQGLHNIDIHQFGFNKYICTIKYFIKFPRMIFSLILFITKSFQNLDKYTRSIFLIPSVIQAYDTLKSEQPDVVHLFWGHYPSLVGFLLIRSNLNIPITMFLGAYDLEMKLKITRKLLKNVNSIVTHSEVNISDIIKLGADINDISVIKRGIYTRRGYTSNLHKFKDCIKQPMFLTASRLIRQKGVEDTIRVFSQVKEVYPKSILNIVGSGPDLIRLEELVANLGLNESIFFHGHLAQERLFELMNQSHFFILMSKYKGERLPNVVKEAMFRECVCITTNTPGVDELISHGKDGFIVKEEDFKKPKKIILESIKEIETMINISKNARIKIINEFSVDNSIDKYIKIWEKELKKQ